MIFTKFMLGSSSFFGGFKLKQFLSNLDQNSINYFQDRVQKFLFFQSSSSSAKKQNWVLRVRTRSPEMKLGLKGE